MSGHAFVRSVFKTTPYFVGVRLRSPCSGVTGAKSLSEPEHLEDEGRGGSCGTEYGGYPAKDRGSKACRARLRQRRAFAQQALRAG